MSQIKHAVDIVIETKALPVNTPIDPYSMQNLCWIEEFCIRGWVGFLSMIKSDATFSFLGWFSLVLDFTLGGIKISENAQEKAFFYEPIRFSSIHQKLVGGEQDRILAESLIQDFVWGILYLGN